MTNLARFLHLAGRLKRLPRTGWLHSGIPPAEVESVADHTFRTTLLAWLASHGDPNLDRDKILKLALIHDLAEALAGDPTPYDPADLEALSPEARRAFLNQPQTRSPERQAAKHAAEQAAITELLANLDPALATELRALWDEAEADPETATPEARFVTAADRLERYLQAREYAAADPSRPLASFTTDTQTFENPTLTTLRDAIAALSDDDLTDP